MINIEFHLDPRIHYCNMDSNRIRVRDLIRKQAPQLLEDIVITFCGTTCIDLDGRIQPFIRIHSNEAEHNIPVLAKALNMFFGMRVETVHLSGSYPGKENTE